MASGSASNSNASPFESFLEGWLVRQEQYLDELVSAKDRSGENRDEDLKELINRVLGHYQEYFEEKSRAAHRNVFLVFAANWFTPLERSFLWIAGFKPGLAFRLATNSIADLSEDQVRKINRLIQETKLDERVLNDELAKIQESVAAPPLLEILRRASRLVDGEMAQEERSLDPLKAALESLLGSADFLRMSTAVKVVDILSPAQTVTFLASAAQLQMRIRTWGLQEEAQRRERGDSERLVGFGLWFYDLSFYSFPFWKFCLFLFPRLAEVVAF